MHSHSVEINGYLHDVGQPYCDNIDFEDYIGDVAARNRQEMAVEGHYYLLDEEYTKTCGLFKHTDDLNPEPEYDPQTHPDSVSKPEVSRHAQYELHPKVKLMDLWLPDENIVITLPPEGQGTKIMRTVEWGGPETGPFDVLGYRYFPDSVLPIPPVFTWLDINNVINTLVCKMKTQAEREKKIVLYDLASADDMKAIIDTPDGATAGIRNVDSVKEIEFGGVSPDAFPFVQYLEQQYSITGGNLYTIGGRETQAETLGQEQMLMANASKQLEDMVEQVHMFTKSIVEKLAWFLWTDPYIQVPVIKRLGNLEVEVTYNQEEAEGDYMDYTLDLEPYSMVKMNPEMRFQRFMQLISGLVLPTAQIAAAQGSTLP